MMKLKVSVIIPTYNRSDFLLNTIKSLNEQNFSGYEIIVVDNSCSSMVKEIVESESKNVDTARYSIRYVEEPNIGLHNARHAGAKAAQGDILVFVDDDIICDKNFLTEILKPYKDPNVGCVGGKILPRWETNPPNWIHKMPKSYLSILDEGDQLREVKWIYGCNFSTKKDLLFNLGGFNPDAFGDKSMRWYRGDGEIGFQRKVRKAGLKILYNPSAVVYHFIPINKMKLEYFRERAFKDGIEASFVKHRYGSTQNKIVVLLYIVIFFLLWMWMGFVSLMNICSKVRASYFKARALYEIKWLIDENLRNFVNTKQWL